MRLTTLLAVAALVFSASGALRADEGETSDIRTISGKSYSHCQVVRIYPDGVTFRHSKGMAKVLFTEMTPEGRKSFGYDPAKAEAYDRKVRDDKAKAREVSAAKNAEYRKAWVEAYTQALQAQALAEAMRPAEGGYYGGGYGFVDFGVGMSDLGFHNNYGNRCNNGSGVIYSGTRANYGPNCNLPAFSRTSSYRPVTVNYGRSVGHGGGARSGIR